MAAKKTARKKTTRKVAKKEVGSDEIVMSIFTGEKAYKWKVTIGEFQLQCNNKVYTTASRAEKAGKDWVSSNLK